MDIAAGMTFRAPYPFTREDYRGFDEDGPYETKSWMPGARFEPVYIAPDDCDHEYVADGSGEIILTVVSVHKPGRYPTRVFFTRQWKPPTGQQFGKNACRCVTIEKFRRLAKGYRFPFSVKPSEAAALSSANRATQTEA
jgi:hypothetical protein